MYKRTNQDLKRGYTLVELFDCNPMSISTNQLEHVDSVGDRYA